MDPKDYYKKLFHLFETASQDLGRRIKAAFASLGDPYLVRSQIVDKRIKEFSSIERKAKQNKWEIAEGIKRVNDLVGYRVVCNNLQDVDRAADLLQENLNKNSIKVSRRDYIKKPSPQGYRAIHLNIKLPIKVANDEMDVGCEVQIRTVLQDAWAHLSRADVYTNESSIKPGLLKKMNTLSSQIFNADKIANELRKQISRPRPGLISGHGTNLDRPTLSYVYKKTFGDDPPEYIVEATMNEIKGKKLRADGLLSFLEDESFKERLQSEYWKYVPEVDIDPPTLFRWAIQAAIKGKEAALQRAKKDGKSEWSEIDAYYMREISAELPASWKDLMEELNNQGKDGNGHNITNWARALNAIDNCAICSEEIVDPQFLAERLAKHYKLRGNKRNLAIEEIEAAIRDSVVEVGDWYHSSLCSYHGYQLSKDD